MNYFLTLQIRSQLIALADNDSDHMSVCVLCAMCYVLCEMSLIKVHTSMALFLCFEFNSGLLLLLHLVFHQAFHLSDCFFIGKFTIVKLVSLCSQLHYLIFQFRTFLARCR